VRKNYTIYKRSNKRRHENSNRREHGVSGCMTSGGTTINIICGMKYTTEMICEGAEHNDESGVNDVCEFSVFVIAE